MTFDADGFGFEPAANRLEDGVVPELGFLVVTGFGDADAVFEVQPAAPVAVESPTHSEICWWNGSLLLNSLNDTSWPLFGGSGLLGSETPSVDFEAVESALAALVAAVEDPSREGGASGVEPAAAEVVVVDGLDEESAVGDFIIFIVRGT
jgi:hypothetical protein